VDDATLLACFPAEDITPITAHWYRSFLEQRFVLPRCQACGTWQYPIQLNCRACWSDNVEWQEISSEGTIELYSALALRPHFLPAEVGAPTVLASVKLDGVDGVRITSALLDATPDVGPRTRVRIGWVNHGLARYPVFYPTVITQP
jgi:uncharacterized OB-fold protein